MLKKLLKKFANLFIRPIIEMYLSKERYYEYNGIRLKIYPGVFHPGFFFSTKFLLGQIKKLELQNKTFESEVCYKESIKLFKQKWEAYLSLGLLKIKKDRNLSEKFC